MGQPISVITGALEGMGLEMATELARRGDTVVLVVRDPKRGEAAAIAVRAATNGNVELVLADFASLASVRKAASEILARHAAIHLLAHNAAIFSSARKTTVDGHELMFGVNHLAPFLFTRLLMPALEAGRARIVFNSGDWKNEMDFDDLESQQRFAALDAFGRSKSANNLFARELAARSKNVSVNAVHPGFVKTTLVREAPLPLRMVFGIIGQTQHEGARWPLRLATDPTLEGVSGKFFVKAKEQPFPPPARDEGACARLWQVSERLVGLAG
ncbi:MAG TPA: SDR family NAD(P)-dependent oxidoreductase [Polyangiaceae bacterium]|jgi:NAD(P)-dependent dehydrogenase (short-subunit alcohol dehydrogenase family)